MVTPLDAVELVPVVEVDPWAFAARERPLPAGTGRDGPGAWARSRAYSPADAGVVGLTPVRPGSWHVPVAAFTTPVVLGRYLDAVVRGWGGPDALTGPDARPVLNGGLALRSGGDVLVEPACCGDLANLSEWWGAAACRQPEWKMVWVGHPWVSVRFEDGRLVFSEPHESDAPTARWSVPPGELGRAVAAVAAELDGFARKLRSAPGDMGVADAGVVARTLAG